MDEAAASGMISPASRGEHLTAAERRAEGMLTGIRLVVYDLDGTLVDSTEAIVETFQTVLRNGGISLPPPGLIESLIGEPMPVILEKLLPTERRIETQQFWDAYIPVYASVSPGKTRVLPGALETLRTLKERGFTQSIATQKKCAVARRVLEHVGLLEYLDMVCGIDDVEHPKPAPDMVELALRNFGVEPSRAVMVDDTTVGLAAGKNAGVHTIGVTTGTHNKARLLTLEPDYVIDCLSELPAIIRP